MATKRATKPATKPAANRASADLPLLPFASAEAFNDWLAGHHAEAPGLWLKLAKKDSGIASVTYPEALDVALCYGWIDGQKGSVDAAWWRQKFTPRGTRSLWSKINREKAEALIASGRMQPAGLAEVERARRDGRWEAAYDSQSKAEVPEDLAAALAENPAARDFFATLDSANRYAVLFRVHNAKRPETRARKITQFVEMLARGEKIHS